MIGTVFCYYAATLVFLLALVEGCFFHHYDLATFMCCSAIFLLLLGKTKL